MKKMVSVSGLALVAASAALLAAPLASAADSASTTIGLLEAQGFDVKVDRVGSAPLDQCEVTSVRNPRVQRSLIDFDDDDNNVFDVERRTITVSLNCAR
ncbi:hypothetical protein MMUR_17230 [Mycolicibacterium murale]|jgi:hypothetical protein|uniref:Uncharacterized protein n=1 Tax=Mycolicibacterium murale TaxID=182220 RepID=A0A7I9WK47_9MYCO|nr:hypothetical protein [Mycolicibacterium murale]GFG57587.1 hypothetical protein MMUR_17230 [Mycolicibacterium murale]